MRILHVYKDYWPVLGGIENHIKLLAERQAAAGHQVTVLVTGPGTRTTIESLDGVRVIKAGRLAVVASTPLSLAFPMVLRAQQPDITHLHFPYPPGEVAQYVLARGRPMVVTYHSDVVRQRSLLHLYRPLMLRVLRSADCVIATTPNYVRTSAVLGALGDRVVVIPFGIEQERFRAVDRAATERVRGQFGDLPIVLFVGVLRYYKGLDYLLAAMEHIRTQLVIVGSGPEEAALRRRTDALGIQGRVSFVGRVPDEDLPLYYAAADVFCLPASERSEAFGLVQVEAMASGLPVVSTELGTGVSYVNRDGESGLVVAPRDPAALAEAINRLITDDELRATLSAGARSRAALFQVDRMVAEIESVYSRVLSQRTSAAPTVA